MGREAEGQIKFRGSAGAGKAVLEGDVIILRGEVRARITRGELAGWTLDGDDLRIATAEGPLVLTLGAKEAAAWVRALERPLPGLAAKLGLTGAVLAIGVADPELAAALAPFTGAPFVGEPGGLVVAEVRSEAEVRAALAAAEGRVLWLATVKGRGSPFGEDAARAIMRGAGWIDTKTCRVSDMLAATRYALARRPADGHMAFKQGDAP